MLASNIMTRARSVLQDSSGTRWSDSELLSWIGSGQRFIAIVRPDACSENAVLTLVAGTKQTIPSDGFRLLDVMRNIKTDGTGGRVVRYCDREALDGTEPGWHYGTAKQEIRNYIYDNRDPLHFYTSPPATTASKLEILYSKKPTDPTDSTSTLSISDLFEDPLLNYVLYRAYSKDAEVEQNATLSAGYLSACMSMLGVKTQKDAAFSPDLNSKGANPNVAALQAGGV